jgi:EAL domain-containing protein (putative c-di-GMP-specific phosphodiesterase class I)
VEDASSLALLWTTGVNYIQGYFLQEPSERITYDFSAV